MWKKELLFHHLMHIGIKLSAELYLNATGQFAGIEAWN